MTTTTMMMLLWVLVGLTTTTTTHGLVLPAPRLSTTVAFRRFPSTATSARIAAATTSYNNSPQPLLKMSSESEIVTSSDEAVSTTNTTKDVMSSTTNTEHGLADEEQQPEQSIATTDNDNAAATPEPKKINYAQLFCNLFPIWTLITAALALSQPATFLQVPSSTFPAQIGLLMLCMGVNLHARDFARAVTQQWPAVALSFAGCYGVMPLLAVLIGKALLPGAASLQAGLVLVACINGAQASNLCTYIGQGDLALSVLMTTVSTLGATVMTPFMAQCLLGATVPVNFKAIALSTLQVVLVPILTGMTVNAKFPNFVQRYIRPYAPILGVLLTCCLVGVSVAGCAQPILNAGLALQASAAVLHGLGGVAGYGLSKLVLRSREQVARTFAMEFAMKSSAFGYLLASLHFAHDFAVRVPSAVSIVWMTLIGSSMAVASRFFPPKGEKEATA